MGSFFKHEQNDLKGVCNLERWPYLFDECGIEVRFIWKRGPLSQGLGETLRMVELMTSLRSLRLNLKETSIIQLQLLKESCHLEFRKVNLLFHLLSLAQALSDNNTFQSSGFHLLCSELLESVQSVEQKLIVQEMVDRRSHLCPTRRDLGGGSFSMLSISIMMRFY